MKRSNFFLGIPTGLLAVASFAFAKAHARGGLESAFCITANRQDQVHLQGRYTITVNKYACAIAGKIGTLTTWPNGVSLVRPDPF